VALLLEEERQGERKDVLVFVVFLEEQEKDSVEVSEK
jgi:hypothetical protein